MEILNNNPGLIFSQVEYNYLKLLEYEADILGIMESFEQSKKRNIDHMVIIYSNLLKCFIGTQQQVNKVVMYISIEFHTKIVDDLQFVMESIQSIEDKSDICPTSLSILLSLLLSSMYLIQLKCQLAILRTLEPMLLKLIKMSLKISYIPIRKVMLIFYMQIHRELTIGSNTSDKQYWLTSIGYQQVMSIKPKLHTKSLGNTEQFYQRLIVNQEENQIGQIIVVGLLRALVKTAGTVSNNQQGVDIHKEWDQFYEWDKRLVTSEYTKFKEQPQNLPDLRTAKNSIIDEYDRHRIIINFTLTRFFTFLLKSVRDNCKVQCSYLIQLITDANGVLVFLKFFEKFNPAIITPIKLEIDQQGSMEILEMCVQNLTKLLYITCNNFPDKINNYLIDYKEYLAIKKFPGLFPNNTKIKKYSHLLLKIQIANFSKKNLKLGNTMKLVSEVYCKYSPTLIVQPASTLMDQLYKFEKLQDKIKGSTEVIQSQEELRKLHLDYNNYHYLNVESPQITQQASYKHGDYWSKLLNQPIPWDFVQNYEQWLEENVWDYYD